MLGYDYPLAGAFWTMLMLFLWFAWLVLLFRTIADIIRSDDLGGGSKALWSLFVIFLPFLGVFVYLMVRGRGMGERDMALAQARADTQDLALKSYLRDATLPAATADELTKLSELKDRGVITEDEFTQQKARILA